MAYGITSFTCRNCGVEFEAQRSAKRAYCTPGCYAESRKKNTRERAAGWRSGVSYTSTGYKLILVGKGEPMANNNGYVAEHRLVMAARLGRPLERHEHVHHVNENRADNRLENLELLTGSQHSALHNTGKSRKVTRWARDHDACVRCARTDRKHNAQGLCVNCYMEARRAFQSARRQTQ